DRHVEAGRQRVREGAPVVRIVFLNPSGELGGAETALLDMLAALTEARPTWDLELVASADGPLLARAGELGIRSVALDFPLPLARLGEWGVRDSAMSRVRFGAALKRTRDKIGRAHV